MNDHLYVKLDKAFDKFNESIVVLYDDLLRIYPDKKQTDILEALGLSLQESARIRRHVQSELFTNSKD